MDVKAESLKTWGFIIISLGAVAFFTARFLNKPGIGYILGAPLMLIGTLTGIYAKQKKQENNLNSRA